MREVEVSRFVPEKHEAVKRALDPAMLIEYEGSFEVLDVEETDEGTLVIAGASRLRMTLRFHEQDDGWYFEQEGDAGPFDEMWTQVGIEPEDHGTRVTYRSGVSLGLPLTAVTDRIAAWKRRGELKRALGNLVADLS